MLWISIAHHKNLTFHDLQVFLLPSMWFNAWKRMESMNVMFPCMQLRGIEPNICFHA